jgi:hypothetical protein
MARTHGRVSTYRHGCRCPDCQAAEAARKHALKVKRRGQSPPDGTPHGAYSTYTNWSCRCEACKTAMRAYMRKWRAVARAGLDWEPDHGIYTTYTNHGCRCESCTAAWRDYARSRYARKKANA